MVGYTVPQLGSPSAPVHGSGAGTPSRLGSVFGMHEGTVPSSHCSCWICARNCVKKAAVSKSKSSLSLANAASPVQPVLSPRAAVPAGMPMSAALSVHHDALESACSSGCPSSSDACGRASVRSTTAVSASSPGGAPSGGLKLSSTKRKPCSVKAGSYASAAPPAEMYESTGYAQNKLPNHADPS
jgi:hypothetical protein